MDTRSSRFSTANIDDQPQVRLQRPGKVDLWHIELDRVPEALLQHLSSLDLREVAQITSRAERKTFLKVRCAIRSVLAQYLGCTPDCMEFELGPGGLCLASPASLLRFHLSHSENLLLVAVTFARQVGIDVEYMRADLPFETLADYYFDPRDASRLRRLDHSDRMCHFYQEWTSSEASRRVVDQSSNSQRCCVLNFTPAKGFSAALAVEGEDFQLDWHRWL
jgi:4'-phosphopantetheinyl transferase